MNLVGKSDTSSVTQGGAPYSREEGFDNSGAMMMQPGSKIGVNEVKRAGELLAEYKRGKANLEERIVQDELWWELRHWDVIRRGKNAGNKKPSPEPTSAWLFNSILNKHADAMDNYPEPIVLPREKSDDESAKVLSSVLPVIFECNDFEQTYSDSWWDKLKHGTAPYGVFWNPEKNNGLGDIDIKQLDLLKIFWEPGITNIQESKNLFIVDLVPNDTLNASYPEHKGKLSGNAVDVKQYIYDDTVDLSDKSVVVDWYYKVKAPSGKTVLHYAKFVGSTLLFASENDAQYRDRGWYDHGLYPVVFDVMFPEKGTPVGFGYVAICKDPQMFIDELSANMLENAIMVTKKRFFVSENTAINEEEFLDLSKPLVHVAGNIGDERIKEIVSQPLDNIYLSLMQAKIDEMKDTAGNRDVNSGGTGSGVTAASAIAALQEAGNKTSRDMISASYRAHTEISELCIELIRQFYDEARSFRITGDAPGGYEFTEISNRGLREQYIGNDAKGVPMYRVPVFDLKIRAQKKNPFSRMEENERAKELYSMGFFNPQRAEESLLALEMMDFEGIDKVREHMREGQTLLNVVNQLQMQVAELTEAMRNVMGMHSDVVKEDSALAGASAPLRFDSASGSAQNDTGDISTHRLSAKVQQAKKATMTDYGQRLAKNAVPSMG